MISDYYNSLSPEPTDEDFALHRRLCDPALVTERLGELVPLLKFVGFRVETMTAEQTVLSVPLLESAMNQNGTHQAAVFYLLADYTLGVGMFATLPGCYTVGVHDRCKALPVQFWLRSGNVKHRLPGTGTIRGKVEISPDSARSLRTQLLRKGRCELTHAVQIFQDDVLVATTEHTMALYADLPRRTGMGATLTQVHDVKTSALMIAGLRSDPISKMLAHDQGAAIAKRMSRNSPQLPLMVRARTEHASRLCRELRFSQVLVLGSGLDARPIELSSPRQKWFLADLPDMLQERNRRLSLGQFKAENAVDIPIDLRLPNWPQKILERGYDPLASTLVLLEGVSMYLTEPELADTLAAVRQLIDNQESRLLLDHVTEELLHMKTASVTSFLRSMARLGEPFVNGFRNPESRSSGEWRVEQQVTAADVSADRSDPVYAEYVFSLLAPR